MRKALSRYDSVKVYSLDDVDPRPMRESDYEDEDFVRPDRVPVVRLETDYGEVYQLNYDFPVDGFAEAEAMASRIRHLGVNLARHWSFVRVVYGSRAYQAREQEMVREEMESECRMNVHCY